MRVYKEQLHDGDWKITAFLDSGDIIVFKIGEHPAGEREGEGAHLVLTAPDYNSERSEFSTMNITYVPIDRFVEIKKRG